MTIANRESFAAEARRRGPTARDYVQDGLIAMWDGVENAGWGIHNPAETTWKDLIGDRDLALYAGASFDAASLYAPAGRKGAYYIGGQIAAQFCDACFEIAVDTTAAGYNDVTVWVLGDSAGHGLATMTGAAGYGVNYIRYSATRVSFRSWALVNTRCSVAVDYSSMTAYVSGVAQAMGTIGASATLSSAFSVLGRKTSGENTYGNRRLYSLRLYSRVPTADEIAANYAIDKVRFNLP